MELPRTLPHAQPLQRPYPLLNGCVLALLPVRSDHWHDFSGNENHGTFSGAEFTAKGRFGPGVYLDGVNDTVNCGNDTSLNITDVLSIEAWMKITAKDGVFMAICSKNLDYYLGLNAGTPNKLMLFSVDASADEISVATPISNYDGKWTHIVGVVSPTIAKMYINGAFIASSTNAAFGGPRSGVSITSVGSRTGTSRFFDGLIDEVRIYNRALSVDEIRYLYDIGKVVV